MEADGKRTPARAHVLLLPFDRLKLNEHGGERESLAAVEGLDLIVPEVNESHAGNGSHGVGDSVKNIFSHFRKNSVSDKLNFWRLRSMASRMMRCVSGPSPMN